MHNNNAILMPGECRVNKFSGKDRMAFGQHQNYELKLASLGFMNGEGLGKFQGWLAFLAKVAAVEVVRGDSDR
jgi:hypothetical protein